MTILSKLTQNAGPVETRAICLAIQESVDNDHGIQGSLYRCSFDQVVASDGGENPEKALRWSAEIVSRYFRKAMSNLSPNDPVVMDTIRQWHEKFGIKKYPIWQIDEAYHRWAVAVDGKISGQRFGQWFVNNYPEIQSDTTLFYMEDSKRAHSYIHAVYGEVI
jgi:hypothetical protein